MRCLSSSVRLLDPYLGHGVATMRLLAAPPHHVDVPPVLRRVGREHGEDEVEKYHQFAHNVACCFIRLRVQS